MKYKPNSNLLTIADSPFPQRFVELLLFIYIIKRLDLILRDSPNHTKEESSDNATVRSDRFAKAVATLCRSNLATWRHKVSHEAFGGAQGEEGTPPWLLLATVPANTPSVSDEPNFFGGGAGSGASTTNSARITGMYFYHPDHLGSITMITDGRGNVLAGGERGGKSHITYRPYGEILRTDSYGPDISKFKYTGQEEDRESGLMYYKARYYDAKIGRFLQQDSMAFPNQVQGMNRMMYVEGNPVGFRDETGNKISQSLMGAIAGYIMAPEGQKLEGALLGYQYGRNIDKKRSKPTLEKSLFNTERWLKNNLLSGDKISRWYNRAFNYEKFENTKEYGVSSVIINYSRSSACEEAHGKTQCGLIEQMSIAYLEQSKIVYSKKRNIFNNDFLSKGNRFKSFEQFSIYAFYRENNNQNQSGGCASSNNDDAVNNEPSGC